MARIGQLFGGRTATDRDADGVDDRAEVPVVDRNGDGVDDRAEAASETQTWRLRTKHDKDGDGIDDRTEPNVRTSIDREPFEPVVEKPVVEKPVVEKSVVDEPVVDEPVVDEPVVEEPVPVRQGTARVSLLAVVGFFFGVVAVAAALTGLLAVWAIPLGALGLLFSFGGIIAGVRPNVAGRGLGTLGVLFSGTAVVFAILAMTGQVSWLDHDTNQIARLNDWLDTKLPWMKDW